MAGRAAPQEGVVLRCMEKCTKIDTHLQHTAESHAGQCNSLESESFLATTPTLVVFGHIQRLEAGKTEAFKLLVQ